MNRSDEPTQPAPPAPSGQRMRFRVISIEDGMTLRQLLGRRLGLGVAAASDLVRAGGVYIGNVRTTLSSLRVGEGERVTIYRGAAGAAPLDPDTLVVVHQDSHCVIVDKPHGVPAAATREGSRGAISQALVQRLARGGLQRPYVGLVFALDPAAAGLAVFTARGQDTASFLAKFLDIEVRRVYRARLLGHVQKSMSCETELILARTPSGAIRLARAGERGGVAARTEFRPLAVRGDATLVETELLRGPTEQIGLHAQALGLPIVGQPGAGEVLDLVCARVAFTHPITGAAIDVRAELPPWAETD